MFERKNYMTFLDANFGEGTPNYIILGDDLEDYSEELNPQVEVRQNILGQQKVKHSGYQVQSSVEPYYAYEGDPLYPKVLSIANERKTGNACKTTKVDVFVDDDGQQISAYREEVMVIPTSVGGDTSGVQIPFTLYNCGNRTAGTWNTSAKTFNPTSA